MKRQVSQNAILVGVDDSEGSRAAIQWGARAAKGSGCPLVFVQAYADLVHPPVRGFIAPEKELRSAAEEIVDRAEAYLASMGWDGGDVERIVQSGPPETLLRDHAENARMVVVGRRGYGGFRDMLIGSTAYRIAEHSELPIVIVPAGWDESSTMTKPVVVGLDEANEENVIGFAFERASLTSGQVRVIHAWQAPLNPYSGASHWAPAGEFPQPGTQWLDEERRLLSERTAGWSDKYSDVYVDRDVLVGAPAGMLLAEAAAASLLVIGCRNHGRASVALLGSVARNLMHHAACPLAVVHTHS